MISRWMPASTSFASARVRPKSAMPTRPSGRLISTPSAPRPSPSAPISTSLKTQATHPPSLRERTRKYPTAVAPPISRRSRHHHGIRFFIDVVMAFARNEANQWIDFDDFYLLDAHQTPGDLDAHTSGRGDGHQEIRDGFGSTLLRYARPLPQAAYDPIGGGTSQEAPARALLYSYITRWMRDFRVDGVRMDSVENVSNWDFIQAYKDRARTLFQERWQAAGLDGSPDAHFLVVGEELTLPFA